MCWCVGGQTANMAEKGMTASGYGTDYTWQIRSGNVRFELTAINMQYALCLQHTSNFACKPITL